MRRLLLIGMLALPIFQSAAEPPASTRREKSVQAALNSVAETCRKAEKPRDLDPLWTELAALKSATHPAGDAAEENRTLEREIEGAIFFVSHWREYLEAHQLGNKSASFETLEELLKDSRWLTLVPRSLVLDRYRERFKYYTVHYPTKTIADIPKAIAALQKLERLVDKPDGKQREIAQFKDLLMIDEFRINGEWDAMEAACRTDPEDPVAICRFKYLILAHAVVGYLGLDGKTKLEPAEAEAAPQFLERLNREAEQNGDWIAQWRLQTYAASLDLPSTVGRRIQITSLVGYLEGMKAETNGNWLDAAMAYRFVLHRNARPAILKAAADRLKAIQAAHPETRIDFGEREDYRLARLSSELNSQLRGIPLRESPGGPPRAPSAPAPQPVWRRH